MDVTTSVVMVTQRETDKIERIMMQGGKQPVKVPCPQLHERCPQLSGGIKWACRIDFIKKPVDWRYENVYIVFSLHMLRDPYQNIVVRERVPVPEPVTYGTISSGLPARGDWLRSQSMLACRCLSRQGGLEPVKDADS